MKKNRPYVLSIAGYDPCGGAGVLADIKTFETIGVYGLAVTTGITYQNDHKFAGVHWLSKKKIKNQLYPLLEAYKVEYVKIGLIESLEVQSEVIELLLGYNNDIKIIWDPILKASAGFSFHKKISKKYLKHIIDSAAWITPNWEEVQSLTGESDAVKGAEQLAAHCNVYLKGGHNVETPATDMIWINRKLDILHPAKISELEKHGTGCVLSSAIAAYMALGNSQHKSCELAKEYTYQFLISNETNLGYHKMND
ncbi:MAG: hydroxymethylpyrimidine/phosphomethylpyrimidine kinase [Chitinophagales bacterium]|nr:hydroxymethylpyrimidine/phosphomethylpyrimidine kinase [Chitinophagales bacterium]